MGVLVAASSGLNSPAQAQTLSEKILGMERGLEQDFEGYFDADLAEVTQPPEEIAHILSQLSAETNTRSAVLWAIPRTDHLHLVLLTPSGEPIVRDLYDVPEDLLRQTVSDFHLEMHGSARNMRAARQLHSWLIAPFESEHLQAEDIDTLLFCLGNGLRTLPLAALHDGEQFLIEKYALTRIPAFNLIQTDYSPLSAGQVLAMGASEFQSLNPLPAVPTELGNIVDTWKVNQPAEEQRTGQSFLNPDFTLPNLVEQMELQSPQVVHLATHAVFSRGTPEDSYIQLWDSQLTLGDIREVNWQDPSVELLVLSACRTAIGDDSAELGFAGITLQSGAKSVLASMWNVSDTGTLALMSEFYDQLGTTTTKAEALRQAQLKMLRGEVTAENGQLRLSRGDVDMSGEWGQEDINDLASPYYWAAFTMVGSPW
ncbi:MAG: CHAT domain-containing protein [Cyanobacteria bacterium J06606_4]